MPRLQPGSLHVKYANRSTGIKQTAKQTSLETNALSNTYIHAAFHASSICAHRSLQLTALDQLGCCATDGQLARLLHFGLEDDLVAVLPHLGDERLAGVDGPGEPDFDVLERTVPRLSALVLPSSIGTAIGLGTDLLLIDSLARKTEEAQTVQNRLLEPAHLGEAGIDMQRTVSISSAIIRHSLFTIASPPPSPAGD